MQCSIKPGLQCLFLTMVFVSSAIQMCAAQADQQSGDQEQASHGYIDVRGVWAEGNTLLVFANVQPCKDCYPPPGVAVLLVSTDGGRTWKKRGPSLAGYEFHYLYEKDGKVWIAGDHTCEGPPESPFVFVPVGNNRWEFHKIYDSYETMDALGWGTNGELIAWTTEMRLEDLERGRQYVYHSLDGGKTWKELGLARKHRVEVESKSIEITHHMQPLWRVVELKDCSGFLVQHRDSESSPWKTVSRFGSWRCPRKKPDKGAF